jgi:type IV pilus assembly protein PilE
MRNRTHRRRQHRVADPRRGDSSRASFAPTPKPTSGFTLIELVIAVAVVAILATIAFPSYEAQLRTSARAEAQSFITDAATRQQQFLVDRRAYAATLVQLGMTPPSSLDSKYTFAIAVADGPPPTYRFTATAVGRQAQDKCPTLTIDNAGNKTPANCW